MFILKKLLKNELLGLLSMNNFFDAKKGKVKNPLLLSLGMAGLIIILLGTSAIYSYMLAYSLITVNAVDLLPTMMLAVGSVAVFFYCALRSSGILFKAGDYDLLMGMPIPDRTLIMSKLIYLYISDLGFSLIFMVPCFGFWWYFTSPDILVIIMTALSLFLIPLLPIALATIIGTLVSFLSGRSRHKTLVSIVSNIVFVCAIVFLSFSASSQNISNADMGNIISVILAQVVGQYPPAGLFYNITQGNVISFFLFAVISLGVTALLILVISKYFKPIRSSLVNVSMKASKKKLTYSNNSGFTALIKKELKRFLTSTPYILNCGIGLILGVGGLIYVVLFQRDLISLINTTPYLYNLLLILLPLAIGTFTSMTTSSGVSLSLEGQSLWVIKHIPVSGYSIFASKIVFQILLTAPVCLLLSIASIILLKIQGIYIILVLIFPLAFSVFVAYLGMLLNIAFPNFSWTNETKIIKQSAPVGLSLFASFAVIGITYLLISMIVGMENAPLVYLAEVVLFVIFSLAANLHLKKNSEAILKNL